MAYPSLVSLAQTMDHILNHDKYRVSVEGKQKIRLIHERVVFLTDFLEDFPEKAIGLEEQIRDLANEAADMIEYFIWERTPTYYRSKNRAVWPSRFRHTGRPYDFHELIVMDDMWSTKAWDDVRNIFPDDSNGSRIMITTRLVDVAAYPDPRSPLYEMRLMDANRSWNLLRQKVFSQQECPPDKESIGKEIARGCGGLPLAIVTIAGVLCKTDVSWEKISRDVNKSVASNAHFEKILSLSYTHLPHHLRPCFLYMGGFPEDHEIRVSTLVKLWIAEGFLKYGDTSKSLEEQAEEYLEDLIKKSLIFATKMKTNGKIKSCGIHDLVRDLCIKIGHEEKFLLNAEKVIPNGKIKCCSVHDLVRSLRWSIQCRKLTSFISITKSNRGSLIQT